MTDQETGQALPRKGGLGLLRNPIVWIPYLLSMPLALFVPDDIFSRSHGAKVWFDFISQYVPIVANYANRSAFPQVAGLYFSIVVIPMTLCLLWASITAPDLFDMDKIKRNRARFGVLYDVAAWLLALLFIFFAYFAIAVDPGYDFNIMPINRSKTALAIFGPIFAGGCVGIAAGSGLRLLKILITRED